MVIEAPHFLFTSNVCLIFIKVFSNKGCCKVLNNSDVLMLNLLIAFIHSESDFLAINVHDPLLKPEFLVITS